MGMLMHRTLSEAEKQEPTKKPVADKIPQAETKPEPEPVKRGGKRKSK